jgi:hypothetical protein
MAKVKIQGHASGTGVITVTAPNTSTDRTITLPDATGTLLNSDGSGANLTNLPSATADGFFASSGLSAKDLGVGLHIKTADSGGSVDGASDELVIEGSGSSGMTILSGTSSEGGIKFGDSADNDAGRIVYDHSSDNMLFLTSGTTQFTITSDGRGLSQFTAEAWANINGTGTPSLQDSHNVSSITDEATGRYTLNWGTAIGNTAYSSVCSTAPGYIAGATNRGSASLEVSNYDTNGSNVDVAQVCCVIFGD